MRDTGQRKVRSKKPRVSYESGHCYDVSREMEIPDRMERRLRFQSHQGHPGKPTGSIGGLSLGLAGMGLALFGCGEPGGAGEREIDDSPVSWLVDRTEEVGLDFTFRAGATGEYYMPEITGSGVALLDYDGDGDLDICLSNGHDLLPKPARSETFSNRLFRQEDDGTFTDVTQATGIGDTGYGMGIAVGDIDNDGDVDVYFSNFGPDHLYLNNGDGTFRDVTVAAGIDVPGWSTSVAFFDYDRDGWLDIFICQYFINNPKMNCFDSVGRPTYCSPKAFVPLNDVLLKNNGDGTFRDVTQSAGLVVKPAAGLGVLCEDLNDDGLLDIYVANDGYMNHLWLNQGDGTFIESAMLQGCAYNLNGQAEAGMGIVGEDFDGDLDLDLFLTHLSNESNTLYANEGAGFRDDTAMAGLSTPSLPYTGFGVVALDLECDGDLDLAIANGRVSRREPRADATVGEPWSWLAEPNFIFINDGDGTFVPAGKEYAQYHERVEVSRGLAAGDLDGDGYLDLVVSNIESPCRVFFNEAPRIGHWLKVQAIDPRYQRDAYHARLILRGEGKAWLRTINPGQSYLSSGDPKAHFGLGDVENLDGIEVTWPDGFVERFDVQCVDCEIKLIRGKGKTAT